VAFKGEVLPGEQPAIVDRQLFDAVQAKLTQQMNNHKIARMRSEALLAGRIFDDRGNRMTPTHVRKRGIKYRYYLSSTLLQGQAQRSGSIRRVPATHIEALVTRSVRDHLKPSEPIDDQSLVADYVKRVEIQQERLIIQLTHIEKSGRRRAQEADTLDVPWRKTPVTRRREMLLPASDPPHHVRPIRSETRATLIASIARGRRWLNELVVDANADVERIAKREGCSVRQVNMTISLAFLAPDLVKAAIEGRLPRHRRHPPARCARRVVSPNSDARSDRLI
jgi:hypothetical protein